MLKGYEKEWVEAGVKQFAYYASLSPGQNPFRVAAGNIDGVWNKAGDFFGFYLQLHFYQTRLFPALLIVVIIPVARLLY